MMTPQEPEDPELRHETVIGSVPPTRALAVKPLAELQRVATTGIATSQAALAVRATAVAVWREKLVRDAQAKRERADALAGKWPQVGAAASAEIAHVAALASAAITEADPTCCAACRRPLDSTRKRRAEGPARADAAPPPEADEKARRKWALDRSASEPVAAPSRRVCSEECGERLVSIDDERANTARATTDALVVSAAKAADDAENEATKVEAMAALVRFDRAALKEHEAATFRAVNVAAEAERAAEAYLAQHSEDFEAELAVSRYRTAREDAERENWAALSAWWKLLVEEAEAHHADGCPWPKRHCLSCDLPVTNPDDEFCTPVCTRAGKSDAGVESGAHRCFWCRRTFLAPEDTVWPDDGDQPPVCTAACLAAAPLDSDLWETFHFPEIVYVGPIPTTSAGRQALSRRLEAASRKRASAAGTSRAPSRSAPRRAVDPATTPQALPDPQTRAREEILSRLQRALAPVRQSDLLRHLGVDATVANRTLAGMVQEGVVAREGRGTRSSPYLFQLRGPIEKRKRHE